MKLTVIELSINGLQFLGLVIDVIRQALDPARKGAWAMSRASSH